MLDRVSHAHIGKGLPIVLLLVCLQAGLLFGQWGVDYRLTMDDDSSFTADPCARCIAAYDDDVHVVWYDGRDGNYEIYHKYSEDGGIMWSADMRLTDDPAGSYWPGIAVSGEDLHVVWEDERGGDIDVYYKGSTDGGNSWSNDTLVTSAAGPQGMPSVAVVGGYVHVVWVDFTMMGNTEIYYCRSTNGGNSWQAPVQISNAAGFSSHPSIAAYESYVHVAWHDSRHGFTNNEIYYRRSTDDGITWSVETRLTEDDNFSNVPSVAVAENNVHVAWEENRDGNFEMYFKSSTDNGQNWGTNMRLTDDAADSYSPSLAASGSNVHLVWQDMRDANEEIYYKLSNDCGTNWDPDVRLTDDTNISQNASICVSGEKVHVAWTDVRPGNWEIYYKRNPTGNTGIAEYTNDAAGAMQLTAMPNPFTTVTKLRYSILDTGYSIINPVIEIYDAAGCLVKSFDQVSSIQNQVSSVVWDGRDDHDRQLGGGVYFVKLEAGDFSATEKILLVR
jgi:hypothetical protein